MADENRFTIDELHELVELERAARGETAADTDRFLRARLEAARAGKLRPTAPGEPFSPSGPTLEARVALLEQEVKSLRVLLENRQ